MKKRMNEIISINGKPFHPTRGARPSRRRSFSVKRVGKALFLIFCSLVLAGAAAWLGYGTLLLDTRARAGEAEAQYQLGKRNLESANSAQSRAEALKWIERAAEQGLARAQTGLGFVYARGASAPKDPAAAVNWFTRAAMQGDLAAQNELAAIYAGGQGVKRDLQKAIHWYRQAAGPGSEMARANPLLAQAVRSGYLGEVTTRNGERYHSVSIRAITPEGITVSYDCGKGGVGIATLKRNELPLSLQPLCAYASRIKPLETAAVSRF
jgi:hypothetical protein